MVWFCQQWVEGNKWKWKRHQKGIGIFKEGLVAFAIVKENVVIMTVHSKLELVKRFHAIGAAHKKKAEDRPLKTSPHHSGEGCEGQRIEISRQWNQMPWKAFSQETTRRFLNFWYVVEDVFRKSCSSVIPTRLERVQWDCNSKDKFSEYWNCCCWKQN